MAESALGLFQSETPLEVVLPVGLPTLVLLSFDTDGVRASLGSDRCLPGAGLGDSLVSGGLRPGVAGCWVCPSTGCSRHREGGGRNTADGVVSELRDCQHERSLVF